MATQVRSFIETFRGIFAIVAALFTFGGSLFLAFSSDAIVDDDAARGLALSQSSQQNAHQRDKTNEGSLKTSTVAAGHATALTGSSAHASVDGAGSRTDALMLSPSSTNLAENDGQASSTRLALLDRSAPSGGSKVRTPKQKLEPRIERQALKVQSRDTLEKILERAGAERQQAYYATKSLSEVHNARSLKIGQAVDVVLEYPVELSDDAPGAEYISDTPILKILTIETDVDETVSVILGEDGNYKPERVLAELDLGYARQGGTIDSSLYVAAIEAGIPDSVIANVIGLYSYDIDFQREIRQGDEFELLYERFYDEAGNALKSGTIQYASMTVQGRQKGYYRFKTTDDGIVDYYDAKGQSAKKFLMRTPINGARISSGFGRRKHPVLGYTKMHQGTDFAAPTGTPIFAAGNGVIERSSRYGSYGNYVRIRHSNGYKTAYAHMSRYGRGIKQGKRVKQGQVIGYVGATGRVTGAHLHYEVLKDGAKVNPLRIKVPTGRKLGGNMLAAFRIERDRIENERMSKPDWRPAPAFVDADEGSSES